MGWKGRKERRQRERGRDKEKRERNTYTHRRTHRQPETIILFTAK